MKNQKGFAILPVALLFIGAGALISGAVTLEKDGPHFHREVLKQGVADYSTLNK